MPVVTTVSPPGYGTGPGTEYGPAALAVTLFSSPWLRWYQPVGSTTTVMWYTVVPLALLVLELELVAP